jgi:hypothetical protein
LREQNEILAMTALGFYILEAALLASQQDSGFRVDRDKPELTQ